MFLWKLLKRNKNRWECNCVNLMGNVWVDIKTNLQLSVLLFHLFVLIRITVWKLIHFDSKLLNLLSHLERKDNVYLCVFQQGRRPRVNASGTCVNRWMLFTLSFIFFISAGVRQSALETSGIKLTLSWRAFINSTSTGRKLSEEWTEVFYLLYIFTFYLYF